MQYPHLKRKLPGTLREIAPKRQAVETLQPIQPLRPSQPAESLRPVAIPRNIQPRPSANGHVPTPNPTIFAWQATPGRKRGRPSKAEKAGKEAQLYASSVANQPQPHGSAGSYGRFSSAPTPTSPLLSVSSANKFPRTISPVPPSHHVVPGSPRQDTLRREQGMPQPTLPQPSSPGTLNETYPSDSNTPRKSDSQETAGMKPPGPEQKSNFPSQTPQMPPPT